MSRILVTRHELMVSCIHRTESPGLVHWNVILGTYLQLCLSWHDSSLWRHSPQSWRHTALVISIFISGGRRACFFFQLFFVSLFPLLIPLSLYLIHKMLFLSLTSALSNCYKQERIGLMEPEDNRCIGNVYQSVVCCRKAAAFVYQAKISVWKSEARVNKVLSSCNSVVLEAAAEFLRLTAWAARTIRSTNL